MKFLVVECKRVKDTSWIFLVEGLEPGLRRHAKCFVFEKSGEEIKNFHWKDSVVVFWLVVFFFCVFFGFVSWFFFFFVWVFVVFVFFFVGLVFVVLWFCF